MFSLTGIVHFSSIIRHRYFSSITWTIVLCLLYFMDPDALFSFCIFRLAGFESCPGCGLGHAIYHCLHFRMDASLQAHILGIPATGFIAFYIAQPFFTTVKTKLHGF